MNFGNAEWCDVGHILCASNFTAAVVRVAHFVAPNVPARAVATGLVSNNQAVLKEKPNRQITENLVFKSLMTFYSTVKCIFLEKNIFSDDLLREHENTYKKNSMWVWFGHIL